MPPDRGAVKKTSSNRSISRDTESRKGRKKTPTPKDSETSIVEENGKTSKRQDVKKISQSPRGKNPSKVLSRDRSKGRGANERTKDIKKDVTNEVVKIKDSVNKRTFSEDTLHRTGASRPMPASRTLSNVSVSKQINSGSPASKKSTVQNRSKIMQSSSQQELIKTRSQPMRIPHKSKVDGSSQKLVSSGPSQNKRNGRSSSKDPPLEKLGRDRTRTRTLSPHEVKIARGIPPQEGSAKKRPAETLKAVSTTALPAGSSTHVHGQGDTPRDKPPEAKAPVTTQADDDYADDFEDYESDFEEDISAEETSPVSSSTEELASVGESGSAEDESEAAPKEVVELAARPQGEEEKKLDSGNYDLAETKRKGRELQRIKEALEKENAALPSQVRRGAQLPRQLTLAKDEGFEEGKLNEANMSPSPKSAGFINFANARKRMQEQKVNAKSRRRGEELLSMIRLDSVGFSLLDLPPATYEVYMKLYGRSNSVQASMQTNEDNLTEEIQTDEIITKNKWTQHPVTFHPISKGASADEAMNIYLKDRQGVGGDTDEEDGDPDAWKRRIKYNAGRLNAFLLSAGQMVLHYLEWKAGGAAKLAPTKKMAACSDGVFSLNVSGVAFLVGRPVVALSFSERPPPILLTVHKPLLDPGGDGESLLGRCMLCTWNVQAPACPQRVLVCGGEATAACLGPGTASMVFAGLQDGAVCVWDLREPTASHAGLGCRVDGWVLRSPTYSTAEVLRAEGHSTKVVAVRVLRSAGDDPDKLLSANAPSQVCSLEAAGRLIVWTAVQSRGTGLQSGLVQEHPGLAHWGRVRLVRSSVVSVADCIDSGLQARNLECCDLQLDRLHPQHLYVATCTGRVVHCMASGERPQPREYSPSKDNFCPATCIEACSFNKSFFLVGFEGGTVQLHRRTCVRPLTTLAATGDVLFEGPAVTALQWAPARPLVFFVLDARSRLHIWDLNVSDIHPTETVCFEKNILSLRLFHSESTKKQFLAVSTADGLVQVYQMKQSFSFSDPTTLQKELDRFLLYAEAL